VVDDRGNAYVNTIGFDFPGGEFAPGLVVLATPDGNVTQVADDLAFPNGMAITPDRGTLIVAESYANQPTAYDIGADRGLGNRRVWAQTPGDHPDGICIDAEGAVWYADVGHQHCVRMRQGGRVLATVNLDRGAFACALSRGLVVEAGDHPHADPGPDRDGRADPEQGRYLGGRPPYGYRRGDAGPHPNKAHAAWGRRAHRLEPDPDTAPVVR
jgi:sugar lactone lactonase YvrE